MATDSKKVSPFYASSEASPHFPALEQDILAYWRDNHVFEKSIEAREPKSASGENHEYVFYDGPPFANGLPHHGHLLTGFVKDLFARYHTMKGKRTERRFGWDCHGLPAEMGAEKELNISGRKSITDFGIGHFNDHCRRSVMQYRDQWEWYVNRQARWVDFENDYKTMDTPFMESVIWAFSELYKKGYIYEGFKVMPYSWSAETVLSTSEIRLDDATREKEDKAVTVAFKLKEKPVGAPDADNYYVLAWTTTPWTLPSNLALAVSGAMEYVSLIVPHSPLAGESSRASDISLSVHSPLAGESSRASDSEGGQHRPSGKTAFATEKARAMRKEPTEAENRLWQQLKSEQLGVKFRRQQPMENYIVDFYCAEKRLVVEVDGGQHAENETDSKRTAWLESQGLRVVRFWNNEVLENMEGVLASIVKALSDSPTESAAASGLASSAPPQVGSGRACYILARDALEKYSPLAGESNLAQPDLVGGRNLIGLAYEPLFPYFAGTPNAFRILDGSSFIEEGSGTGIVHMAPGFGEDDQRVCAENGIDTIVPVNSEGRYTDAIYDLPAIKMHHPEREAEGSSDSSSRGALARNDETAMSQRKLPAQFIAAEGSENLADIIETKRCILRRPTAEDEAHFIGLHTNAKVMETMNDGPLSVAEAKEDFARNTAHFEANGFGQWAVFHKETGAFMGRAGLTVMAQSAEMPEAPTLRCCLHEAFWHGGYGTELCHAALWFGFTRRGFATIVAGAHPDNPRAVSMMTRLGMHIEKQVMFKRKVGPYLRINKETFEAANPPLRLRGLNVIKETKLKADDEPYKPDQLEKYGLANLRIIAWLKARGRLIKQEDYKHNYPHCWRTDQPIIYMAMSSWFVDVPQFRDRMVALNQDINWIPSHIKDGRFGKWLEGAREWSISRSRFWGCPIPVWRSPSGKIKVFGSIAELEAASGQKITDLHRPHIDKVVIEEGGETYTRVEDVFDCWFESGSMPYAQVHYPFENKEWFESHFPADFIVEYEAQTRGWFYSMMVLSVALFDRIPFKNCICHGVVLDESGRKLSKKLQNYMDPKLLFDQYGSDALRWFMMASPIMRGSELLLDAKGQFIHDAIRLYLKPIWNAYHFFTLYANADGVRAVLRVESRESSEQKADSTHDSDHLFDRYILAKCAGMVKTVTQSLDAYDTPAACVAITEFVEILNNWYIRRNKDRFWNDRQDADKQAAYNTLYTVLHILCRTCAPLLPMMSEAIYRGLHGLSSCGQPQAGAQDLGDSAQPLRDSQNDSVVSVHLADWPKAEDFYRAELKRNSELLAAPESGYMSFQTLELTDRSIIHFMDRVRDICNVALAIRSENKIRVRQPLRSLKYFGDTGHVTSEFFGSIIKDEINVHKVDFSSQGLHEVAEQKLTIFFPIAGKRLGAKMKAVGAAAKAGDWKLENGQMIVGGEVLQPDEYTMQLIPKAGIEGAQALSSNDALVVLDLEITPELKAEGIARDVVRMIQQARKDADLHVADRIHLRIETSVEVAAAIEANRTYIADQTLAISLLLERAEGSDFVQAAELDGASITLGLSLAKKDAA